MGILQWSFDLSMAKENVATAYPPKHPFKCGYPFTKNYSGHESTVRTNIVPHAPELFRAALLLLRVLWDFSPLTLSRRNKPFTRIQLRSKKLVSHCSHFERRNPHKHNFANLDFHKHCSDNWTFMQCIGKFYPHGQMTKTCLLRWSYDPSKHEAESVTRYCCVYWSRKIKAQRSTMDRILGKKIHS